jgi:hypothetical protein
MRRAGSLWLFAGALAAVAACGGESASHGSTNGGAGRGGGGGLGTASSGAPGTGGTLSLAGQPGGAGMVATSDLPPCVQPVDPGTCRGAFAVYAFDPESITCRPFTYGGCDGNQNRFETLEACEAACVSSLPSYCDESPRPTGCPCTAHAGCAGVCAIPDLRGDRCAPSAAGYCEGVTERCSCGISGSMVCGA